MLSGVMLDRCGLDEAMRGRRPAFSDAVEEPALFVVPFSEYQARVSRLLDERRYGRRPKPVVEVLEALDGAEQPIDLSLTALSDSRIPRVLYSIPLEVQTPGTPEHLTAVRLIAALDPIQRRSPSNAAAARFVAACLHSVSTMTAVVCGSRGELLSLLRSHELSTSLLEHECRRPQKEAS